jgi:hypothetical protein
MGEVKIAKRVVLGSVLVILALTIMEFPSPIGFETRPQNNVSLIWLVFFLIILIVEIAAIPLIYKRPKIGAVFGVLSAILNILQALADQLHLMQPEVAPWGYLVLEDMVVMASFVLIHFSWNVWRGSSLEK